MTQLNFILALPPNQYYDHNPQITKNNNQLHITVYRYINLPKPVKPITMRISVNTYQGEHTTCLTYYFNAFK